jgi:hypothetical protein
VAGECWGDGEKERDSDKGETEVRLTGHGLARQSWHRISSCGVEQDVEWSSGRWSGKSRQR